ncbi:MAG: GGDEF domain-containing protein [Sphingomonas sp.]
MATKIQQWGEAEIPERALVGRALFDAVGAFLDAQRLGPDPVNYEFAYRICSNPEGSVAKAVATLTDGGVRLTKRDITSLGGMVGTDRPVAPSVPTQAAAQGLVAQTQIQVEGFQDLVSAIRSETSDFGRNLEESAKAIHAQMGKVDATEFIRLTTAMLARVRVAETQLEEATQEAVELRGKLEEARDNARRDPLTSLPNRRAFEEIYDEWLLAGAPMCIAVVDIDHFKKVNDTFGHAVGDRVLKAIGEVLADVCTDHFVARYGGEEFVVVFNGIELQSAGRLLNNARVTVADKRYRLRESDAPLGEVTFSAGLTAAKPTETAADSFRRADELLYAAKAGGRNCVIVK